MSRRDAAFLTIGLEGGLLPVDLLQRLSAGEGELDGMRPEDYDLSGERVGEAVSRSWTRLEGAWLSFQHARERTATGAPTAALTRRHWLSILFQELGYGQLQPLRASVQVDGRDFPLSHLWGSVPIHLVGYEVGLDEKRKGVVGAARMSPHGLVQEFLNRSNKHLWGVASNGLTLRILRDNASLTRQAYVEFDLEAMFDGAVYSDFVLLWMLGHESRFRADVPEECWLESWRQFAAEEGTRALDQLRAGVEEALRVLGQGYLAHPDNQELRDSVRSGVLTSQAYYRQLLRMVYRLIFLFVAEDRGVLLDPEADELARERYHEYYSTARLRELARRQHGTRHSDLYEVLRLVMAALAEEGEQLLGLYPLNGRIFRQQAIRDLAGCKLTNQALLRAIWSLSNLRTEDGIRVVSYRLLGSRELGSVYESLLELHPTLTDDPLGFRLEVVQGSERKSTGSYYSPEPLIQLILDNALDPLLEEAEAADDPESAILNLRLVDPSVGGGHFLVSAAHRIAYRLASVRTGDEEPPADSVRHALRDVIGRCLYGVDVNPMAVELCKVALWMEAVEPGRPLSFLDHRIVVGNSMLGATPRGIEEGMPDDAFSAIEGDHKKHVSALRRRNKDERKSGQLSLTLAHDRTVQALRTVEEEVERIDEIDDGTVAGIQERQRRWEALHSSDEYRRSKLVADAWVAAFVMPKTPDGPAGLTEGTYQTIRANPDSVSDALAGEIDRLAERYRFFHWHLAFPDVLRVLDEGEQPETETPGWSGGFDLVLGNPPWDTMSPDEKEFFSVYDPLIRFEDRDGQKAIRDRLLRDDGIKTKWEDYRRDLYAAVHFIKNSGRYQLFAPGNLGKGDFNTYRFFVETALQVARPAGWAAQIVPEGFYSGANAMAIRKELFKRFRMALLFGFENRGETWFEGIHRSAKFAVYVAKRGGKTEYFDSAFNITSREELAEARSGSALAIPVELVERFSPEALAMSEFESQQEIDIASAMYDRWPAFGEEVEGLPYRQYQREVDMGNDRDLFTEDPENDLPVYEGRMVQQYDHRAKGYTEGRGRSAKWEEFPFEAAGKRIQPQWTVPEEEIPEKLGDRPFQYRIGFCDVASPTNERSLVATLLPPSVISGHSVPTILFGPENEWYMPVWLAAANSFALDFLARQKISLHMTYSVMDSLPFPRLEKEDPRTGVLIPLVLDLVCTEPRMIGFWNQMAVEGFVEPVPENGKAPGLTDPDARLAREAEIDAFVASELYRLEPQQMEYILSTFPIVQRRQEEEYGEYRSRRLILEAMEQLRREEAPPDVEEVQVIPFARVAPSSESRYVSAVPLHDLQAAAGNFGSEQAPSFIDWVEVPYRPLKKGMFVAQVMGQSMEPTIADGAFCLFRYPVLSLPSQGEIVLVEHSGMLDSGTGQYTVKRFYSETHETEGERSREVRLVPDNPEFETLHLSSSDGDNFKVVARLVTVLGHEQGQL